ncbi:MAG TPA: AI-2E family transporter [Vicinamibacterales bacterium]|nr:AI-2E family transporter [Vicinamibacterales bacterium]
MPERDARPSFAGPRWLRDAGIVAWMIVGIVLVVVGAIALLSLTSTIVMPLITALIIASVSAPGVRWLSRHRVPRAAASGLVLIAIVVAVAALVVIVVGGITSQSDDISARLHDGSAKVANWAKDAGVGDNSADSAKADAEASAQDAGKALLNGAAHALSGLASLGVFLSFTAIILFFTLKDGPSLRAAVERNAGVPEEKAHLAIEEMLRAMRGYFAGTTIVAAFNAVVIGLGALILGVPLAGTIAIVTFVGAYIPYLGAWTAGAFAVLLALGGPGPEAALAMAVIALLGNGILQQMVQPLAMGTALDLHPIVVLVVTIGAGSLFGTIGLILAAPVTSAIRRITARLREAREAAGVSPESPLAASATR